MEQHKIVGEILAFVEENLTEELSLDKIADAVNYSKFYIGRLFAEDMGCTIYKYIQKRRMTEAARQLAQTQMPIVEIAYEACYQSQQAFTQAFVQLYGITPQAYRRSRNPKVLQSKSLAARILSCENRRAA